MKTLSILTVAAIIIIVLLAFLGYMSTQCRFWAMPNNELFAVICANGLWE